MSLIDKTHRNRAWEYPMNKEQIDKKYFYEVAARATTLREKIDEPQRFLFHPASERLFEQRLTEWREVVAPSDSVLFENRLKNDGLKEDDLKNLLGTVSFSSENQLPSWIIPFRELMGFLSSYDPTDISAEMARIFGPEQDKKIPFLHLLTPLTAYAIHQLDERTSGHKTELFSSSARQMLHLQLALILEYCTSHTFQLEFDVYRSSQQSSLSRIMGNVNPGLQPQVLHYQTFYRRIIEDGWKDFFAEYSVLARIITILLTNWVNNNSTFILRLASDFSEITKRFAGGALPGLLTAFKGSISDAHDGGKGVISLKFESGLQLVYKPKDLALEQAWSELINWFNEKGLKPDLKPLHVISREGYGWAGFVEAAGCGSEQEVADYYCRIGALIGIIYLLNGNDCHFENLIASGAYPTLIDLESVMHHDARPFADELDDNAMFFARNQLGNSVFRTGFLPSWIKGKDGFLFDMSGIGGYGNGLSPYRFSKWHHINTDQMKLSFTHARFLDLNNLPVLNGQQQKPLPYTEQIVAGFTAFYKLVILHRNELPIHLFARKELRFIFRSTRIYAMVIKKLMNPKYMRTGIERSIGIELLTRAFLHNQPPNPYWSVSKSELRQMEEMDIPIFWADSDKADLKDNSGIISAGHMRNVVYDEVKSQMEEMDEKDLDKQVKFIRASLFFKEAGHDSVKDTEETHVWNLEEISALDKDKLIESVVRIGRILQSEAIFSTDGSCSWMSAGIIGTNRFRIQPMSMFLYDGMPGMVLFLSALYAVTADPEIKRLNDAAIQSLRQVIDNMYQYQVYASRSPIGITSGIASVIYALLKISDFLGDPSFITDAEKVSAMVTPAMIQKDRYFDILSGSAGCILGMLALHKHSGHNESLEKAILCGEHLLKNVTKTSRGLHGWITSENKMLAGFSHGQAGIAYALLKLYEVTGNTRYREAAEQAIRYENTLYSPEHNNWEDLRGVEEQKDHVPYYMSAWCHGAPGLGLARLASKHLLSETSVEKDIQNAIKETRRAVNSMTSRDHICCGNLGLADILLYFAQNTGDKNLLAESAELTARVLLAAEKRGHFNILLGSGENLANTGFFQGLTGIGYSLLRQAFPDRFPCNLIFE
jgi:type 2 lantibiotic biosynthesis protein LanM